jgi:hypothetical protein
MGCLGTDPDNRKKYRALLDRNGFVESARFLKYMVEGKEQPGDFAEWERGQQEQPTCCISQRQRLWVDWVIVR